MPKIVSELDRQTMHQQIIKVAAQEFARVGFESVRMETIADKAGIGKGTIYLYFASKQKLFSEMLKEIATEQLAELRKALAEVSTDSGLKAVLGALIGTFNRLGIEQPDNFRIFISSLYGVNRQFKEEAAHYRHAFLLLIENLLADFKTLNQLKGPVEPTALLILNVCESLALQAEALGFEADYIPAQQAQIIEILLHGLS